MVGVSVGVGEGVIGVLVGIGSGVSVASRWRVGRTAVGLDVISGTAVQVGGIVVIVGMGVRAASATVGNAAIAETGSWQPASSRMSSGIKNGRNESLAASRRVWNIVVHYIRFGGGRKWVNLTIGG